VTEFNTDSPETGWNIVAEPEAVADGAAPTRREFLLMAGMGAAAATLIQPGKLFAAAGAAKPEKILVAADALPAIQSAAKILAKKLKLDELAIATYVGAPKATAGAVVLALTRDGKLAVANAPKGDGYTVTYTGGIVVWGARLRSVLFAAGEPHHWVRPGKTGAGSTPYRRNPAFKIRVASYHVAYPVAEQTAIFGANLYTANLTASPALQALPEVFGALSTADQKNLVASAAQHKAQNIQRVKEFHDADVEVYALLPYGNNFATWSPALYAATIKAYPNAKGVPMANSHESAALCPSDADGWTVLETYVKEWAEQCAADGISATFWDNYSAFCQDARCKVNGLNKFPNEVHEFLFRYYALAGDELCACAGVWTIRFVASRAVGKGNQGDAGGPDDADQGVPLRLRAKCALHHIAW